MEAKDAEVLENEATELRCVVTLSNPDSELATVTIEKIDNGEPLTSTRLGYIAKYYILVCVYLYVQMLPKFTASVILAVLRV